jgi:hypothetical protein
MKLTDSKEKLLPGPEIVAQTIYNQPMLNYTPEALIGAVAAESTLPNTDIVQIGNTVFIAHTGKGKNKRKMVGRALNVDTGRNFVVNGFKYFTYLQQKGVTHYTTTFTGPVFLNAFKIFQRRAKKQDTEIGIGRLKKYPDMYVVFIRLGKEPLAKGL